MRNSKKQCECGNSEKQEKTKIKVHPPMILNIKWKRLISDGKTCPRCGSTEEEINDAINILNQSLSPLEIKVILKKEEISFLDFKKNPLESNRIWINNRPLEDYIGGLIGKSECCDVCGHSECRTVNKDEQVYETIPSKIIIQAGLIAASQLIEIKVKKSS